MKDKTHLLGFAAGTVVSGLTATKAPLFDSRQKDGAEKSEFKCHEKEFSPDTRRYHDPIKAGRLTSHKLCIFTSIFFTDCSNLCKTLHTINYLAKTQTFSLG